MRLIDADRLLDRCVFYHLPNGRIAVPVIDVQHAPTVEPRMKGRWVKISPANIYECSNCGKNVMTDDISEYDFCHGCGADMREEEPHDH